jgi:TPR repeat protein
MKKQIAGIILGLGLHAASIAGVAEGVAAYNEHNYPLAIEEIMPPAQAGNADAQHLLGAMYYTSNAVPRDAMPVPQLAAGPALALLMDLYFDSERK